MKKFKIWGTENGNQKDFKYGRPHFIEAGIDMGANKGNL